MEANLTTPIDLIQLCPSGYWTSYQAENDDRTSTTMDQQDD
jgi:hypothetical protein